MPPSCYRYFVLPLLLLSLSACSAVRQHVEDLKRQQEMDKAEVNRLTLCVSTACQMQLAKIYETGNSFMTPSPKLAASTYGMMGRENAEALAWLGDYYSS